MKILHVIATPRGEHSQTLPFSQAFLGHLAAARSDLSVQELDLSKADLPAIDDTIASTKYRLMQGLPVDREAATTWPRIEALIEDFLAADLCLITTPMWNFGLPHRLKHWIDCVVQPGYTFAFDGGYPSPLVQGTSMVCITSRGSDYSPTGPMGAFDFQEPYLRAIFGFIGVTDMEFVHAQPLDHPVLREQAHADAMAAVEKLASEPRWAA
jgi:FMN-dependent NADH-azoreductase